MLTTSDTTSLDSDRKLCRNRLRLAAHFFVRLTCSYLLPPPFRCSHIPNRFIVCPFSLRTFHPLYLHTPPFFLVTIIP